MNKNIVCILGMVSFCLLLCKSKEGSNAMDTSLYKVINAASVDDTKLMDSIASSIKVQSSRQPSTLIEIIHNPQENEDNVIKARMLLLMAGNGTLTLILDSLQMDNPDAMMFDVNAVVALHEKNQARIVKVLEKLLGDKRPMTPPDVPLNSEEKPPQKRVCDEAYVKLRRLCTSEDEENATVNEHIFFTSSEKEKDDSIGEFQKSNEWKSLREQVWNTPERE